MILINQLSMSYGQHLLFYDVNLNLTGNRKYALVGGNGSGKSTLLKLISGEEEAISGGVSIPKDAVIGWLKQDQFLYEDALLTDIVIQGKPALWDAMVEKEKLLNQNEWNDKAIHRLSALEDTIAHHGGYTAISFAEKLLAGLGIDNTYHQKPLSALSGGYKLRVLLAQALFLEPDILLLDEPTNHLDIISIHWLEKYLKSEFKGLVLFISHDVEFINRLADYILDVDYGEIRQYTGNYEKFVEEKKAIEEQILHEKKHVEQRIAEMQRFVDKFRASPSRARQAQARIKMIEKLDVPDIKQSSRSAPHFAFSSPTPSAKNVLRVKNLSKKYNDKQLFQCLNFEVSRGEKMAIIGENGIGKSTLIKTLLDKIPLDEGTIEWGSESRISYFSQDHHDLLDHHETILHWVQHQVPQVTDQQIRRALGQVLFIKDDVQKDILSLSGGEAARLLLSKIMLECPNVLILDEPTNHMDIETTDALARALIDYTGTLIIISHDRYFLSRITNRVIFIKRDHSVVDYKGSFVEFEKLNDI